MFSAVRDSASPGTAVEWAAGRLQAATTAHKAHRRAATRIYVCFLMVLALLLRPRLLLGPSKRERSVPARRAGKRARYIVEILLRLLRLALAPWGGCMNRDAFFWAPRGAELAAVPCREKTVLIIHFCAHHPFCFYKKRSRNVSQRWYTGSDLFQRITTHAHKGYIHREMLRALENSFSKYRHKQITP